MVEVHAGIHPGELSWPATWTNQVQGTTERQEEAIPSRISGVVVEFGYGTTS